MAVTVQRAIHPLHAFLLAGAVPLFLGALLSDITYARSYQIQWSNFASWLIAGALVFAGFAIVMLGSNPRSGAGSVGVAPYWAESGSLRPHAPSRAVIAMTINRRFMRHLPREDWRIRPRSPRTQAR